MRLRLPSSAAITRKSLVVSLAALVIASVGAIFVVQHQGTTTAHAASNSPCSVPSIVAAEAFVPVLNMSATSQKLSIPAGEPAVVAIVNGEQITAVELEQRVQIAIRRHQQQLGQVTADTPADVKTELQLSPGQLRREILDSLIIQHLLLQDATRLGITATLAQAQAVAQQQLRMFKSLAPTDPSSIEFQAYLCVNHLSEANFATNSQVLHLLQQDLIITALHNRVRASMPTNKQKDPVAVQAAIQSYEQHLRQAASIQILLPA